MDEHLTRLGKVRRLPDLNDDDFWFSRRLAAVTVIEEASSVRESNDAEELDAYCDLWFSSLMGMRGLSLAALSAPDACRSATRFLFAYRVGGSHGSIVGLDPGLHPFGRFHIKACLFSHQDKGLGHAKVGRLLQRSLQTSSSLRRQACQHLIGLWQLIHALEKVPKCL